MFKFLGKLFDTNTREVDKLLPIVANINSLEEKVKKLKDKDFPKKTEELRERVSGGEELDLILPEAFALVREAARRTIDQRHFDVQLLAAIVLHQGKIAEQKTSEGKTLSATPALYLNSLTGQRVHLVTVNDYLARRDAGWIGPIIHFLGRVSCNDDIRILFLPCRYARICHILRTIIAERIAKLSFFEMSKTPVRPTFEAKIIFNAELPVSNRSLDVLRRSFPQIFRHENTLCGVKIDAVMSFLQFSLRIDVDSIRMFDVIDERHVTGCVSMRKRTSVNPASRKKLFRDHTVEPAIHFQFFLRRYHCTRECRRINNQRK